MMGPKDIEVVAAAVSKWCADNAHAQRATFTVEIYSDGRYVKLTHYEERSIDCGGAEVETLGD